MNKMTRDQLAGKYLRLCAELRAIESGPRAPQAVIRRLVGDLAETWDALKRLGAAPQPLCHSSAPRMSAGGARRPERVLG
jgi:hypothetical protein